MRQREPFSISVEYRKTCRVDSCSSLAAVVGRILYWNDEALEMVVRL
jgi:hypothetical protein